VKYKSEVNNFAFFHCFFLAHIYLAANLFGYFSNQATEVAPTKK